MRIIYPSFLMLSIASFTVAKPQEVKTLDIGSEAPDFTLPGVDGKNHSLKDSKDAKALVVVFTCNHCPDARAASGKIKALHADYKDKDVTVIAISGNDNTALIPREFSFSVYEDSFEDMKKLAKEEDYQFPYLYDGETQKTTLAYGAVATPHVFIFDADRKLRYHGRVDDSRRSFKDKGTPYVRKALDAILDGKEIETKVTRAHGCSTKWSWKRGSVAQDQKKWRNLPVTLADLSVEEAKSLTENKTNKLRIINLWSTTCGPCIAEFPDLVDTARRYDMRPMEVITISTDLMADREKVATFLKSQMAAASPRVANSLKKEGRASNNYIFKGENIDHLAEAIDSEWSGALPHTLIIAPGGKVLWRHNGKFDAMELRRQIIGHFDLEYK